MACKHLYEKVKKLIISKKHEKCAYINLLANPSKSITELLIERENFWILQSKLYPKVFDVELRK